MDIAAAVDAAEDPHYIEDIPRLYCARTTLADRRARGTEDKAAGQCRSDDLGVSVDSLLTTLLDLAVADATARSYRRPPPLCPPPAATTPEEPPPQPTPSHPPRLLGQTFTIEHRVHEKKTKFRPFFIGAAGVEDASQALCSLRAGGLGSAWPGRSGLTGVLADLVSFPYLTTFSRPDKCHFCKA
jgi:hypothetical protein